MKIHDEIGIGIPEVFLPRPEVDLTKWAVIACDQFTSEPEYWDQVRQLVGDAPSTYNLILPEVYLGKPEETLRIQSTQQHMREYLDKQILLPHEGLIYVERTAAGKTRKGLMVCLDLEKYDYNKGSTTLIRATEGTIIDRLPPRIKIREGAPLELPHIMVLIDDPEKTVIEPIQQQTSQLTKLYDFDLMLGSGHLTAYSIDNPSLENQVMQAIYRLADPKVFKARYDLNETTPVLLFALGDGNHSLATAKAIWENLKPQVGLNHPARFALVELENVHDPALEFEPIHRVLFDVKGDIFADMQSHYGQNYAFHSVADASEMVKRVDQQSGPTQLIGAVSEKGYAVIEISRPAMNLPVGTLQAFLDGFVKNGGASAIDYVHGEEVVCKLGSQSNNIGFYLPGMDKSDLFKTVILDGALPRKTFSMGEAKDKRFYMECRKIS